MERGRNARKSETRHLVGFQLFRQPPSGHAVIMSEQPIDELRELAEAIASGPDDVADFGADAAALYRRERLVALGLLGLAAMIDDDERAIDEQHPLLVAVRERLRDRLRELLAWARATGRMT